MTEKAFVFDEEKEVEVRMIPVEMIDPNPWNPNEMDDKTFNALVQDISSDGFLQTITVIPYVHPKTGEHRFMIIDGEHRFEAMKLADQPEVACIVSRGTLSTDQYAQQVKTVRMNKLRGNLNSQKMRSLVESILEGKEISEVADDLLYGDPSELEALIGQARKTLPSEEMKKDLDKAKSEIRTVEDLSNVLNRLFTKYGDTVPYHYMVVEFGGKSHLWVRLGSQAEFTKIKLLADMCRAKDVRFDKILIWLLETYLTEPWVEENKAFFEGKDEIWND